VLYQWGTDNNLKIYDKAFNEIKELTNINDWIYFCFEREKTSDAKEKNK
jgi:hypothetical protein